MACWLCAPLPPWGRRLWAAAEGHAHGYVQQALDAASADVQNALLRQHPLVLDDSKLLADKLAALPAQLHHAACDKAVVPCPRTGLPGLVLEAALPAHREMFAIVREALPQLGGVQVLSLRLRRDFLEDAAAAHEVLLLLQAVCSQDFPMHVDHDDSAGCSARQAMYNAADAVLQTRIQASRERLRAHASCADSEDESPAHYMQAILAEASPALTQLSCSCHWKCSHSTAASRARTQHCALAAANRRGKQQALRIHLQADFADAGDIQSLADMLPQLTKLESFTLPECAGRGTGIVQQHLAALCSVQHLTRLQSLEVSQAACDGVSIQRVSEHLPHLPNLSSLSLTATFLLKRDIRPLASALAVVTTLTKLKLHTACAVATKYARTLTAKLAGLCRLQELKWYLKVECNSGTALAADNVFATVLTHSLSRLSRLQTLKLCMLACRMTLLQGVLTTLTGVTALKLSGWCDCTVCMGALAAVTQLRRLQCDAKLAACGTAGDRNLDTDLCGGAVALPELKRLTYLKLLRHKISLPCMRALAAALADMPHLVELHLPGCYVGSEAATELYVRTARLHSLHLVRLVQNYELGWGDGSDWLRSMHERFPHSSHLLARFELLEPAAFEPVFGPL